MTKEQVYDAEIFPLMAKIIDVCRANKIAMLADFHLGGDLKCTTQMLEPDFEPGEEMLKAADILLKSNRPPALMITTKDKDGNVLNMTAVV